MLCEYKNEYQGLFGTKSFQGSDTSLKVPFSRRILCSLIESKVSKKPD